MKLTRIEFAAGAGFILLLSVAVLRVAMPEPPQRRRLSIEGIEIPGEAIQTGQTIVREAEWRSRADVYIVGWSYSIGSLQAGEELLLRHGDTVLFYGPSGGVPAANPALLPDGTGYRLRANEPLTLRLSVRNTGPAGRTPGAKALIYFVPVAGD